MERITRLYGRFRRAHLRWVHQLCALLLLCAMSCTDPVFTSTTAVAGVELTAPTQTLRAGATLTLSVRVRDPDGNAIDNVPVYWSSSDQRIATVSSTGVVTATKAGEVTIAASALGKSATQRFTITDREVASVQIVPTSVSVRIGTTVTLTAHTTDAEGATLVGRALEWTSSNTAIAAVTNTGVITGVQAGAVTITATSEGRSGTAAVTVTLNPVATVTVRPSPDTLGVGTDATLTATLRDAAGLLLANRNVAWNSTNVQVATVSSTGVVTALSPGNTLISAVSEGKVGSANIVVLARLASTVTLTPSSSTIIVGNTLQLTSQVTDPYGNILNNKSITFISDKGAVATVTAAGLVTAITPGTARITATSEGKVGTATIVVNPLPVGKVVISPSSATIFTGTARQLTAQTQAASGAALPGRSVTWTSGAPDVASVSATGLVTPIGPGVALIVAVSEGVAGFSTITVQAPVVTSVSVSGGVNSIPVSSTVQLTAAALDKNGVLLSERIITWSSSDQSTAFVTSSGLVIGLKVGQVTITATSEGVSGRTVISVR